MLKSIAKKSLNPIYLRRAVRLHRNRKQLVRCKNDPQLKLYAQLFPSGFLHYGYFDNTAICPRDMSLNAITDAQLKYAEVLLEKVLDRRSEVLDVGCGMGGLVGMMLKRGWKPVALSPDAHQIDAIKELYPQTPTIQAKFEDIDVEEHRGRYGTVINAESLNYLHLEDALPLINQVLKPEGRWVICDFFRMDEAGDTSGHWEHFEQSVKEAGFYFSYKRDITPHILPTIAYAHMLGEEVGLPVIDFSLEKLRGKQPGLHYLLEESLDALLQKMKENLQIVNPVDFQKRKKYMLLVVERGTGETETAGIALDRKGHTPLSPDEEDKLNKMM